MTGGSFQDWPLLVWKLIDHAALNHGAREILTRTVEGPLHRTRWSEVRQRAKRVAQALASLGIKTGDRVATLAWNTHRHIECWYGISGLGAVAHTINPRLFPDQIVYIAHHAQDRVLLFDPSFIGLVEVIAPRLPGIEHFVLMTDRAHMPPDTRFELLCYEDWIAECGGDFSWTELDERAPAGLCYTSGTTGNPKGVLYTHRSSVLHAWAACQLNAFAMSARTVVLPVVPMYHANAWGLPYAAAAVGAKIVMSGPSFEPEVLQRLIVDEGVTLTAAVPTVWLSMLQYLQKTGKTLGNLERVVIGGAAAPPEMVRAFECDYGVTVAHAWGMTETSPLGTVGVLCADGEAQPLEKRIELKCKQGRALFGVEMRIQDDNGREVARDGRTSGHLAVRGPWVLERYFKGDGGQVLDEHGWLDTGDIATIDPLGYMQITDRAKDVIKSGGEWISSILLENAAVSHPAVAEAAVIGIPHPKWGERPLLCVVRKAGASVSQDEIILHLRDQVAKWWLPDEVVFVEALPHTATGKILKAQLRKDFEDYRWTAT